MFRLGLRLTLRSGREAFVRLLVTAAAVAVGVAIMLCVLADFYAFVTTNDRPYWEGTQATSGSQRSAADVELWSYSNEVFRGQTIERLDLAALGPRAPVPPGITRLPRAGQYYASPALAALIRRVPPDQLGDRFPGTLAGTIGHAALTGPDELVVYVGEPASRLAGWPAALRVDKIFTGTGRQVWTHYFRDAFIVGAIAFLLPILILIGTATRLASARREERYASLRLVGATARDINVVASAEATVSALLGALAGIGIFELLQAPLAATAVTSAVYFPAQVTPTIWGYLGVLVAVPVASALASLVALRRVRITPLGVSRRVTPPAPGAWRTIPLLLGIVLFVAGMLATNRNNIGTPAFPGLIVIMIGLVVAGPWLTSRAARLLPAAGGASALVAARRLADNPKAAFRSVTGLVLAVFLGTVVAGLLPAVDSLTANRSATALHNVLLADFMASSFCGNSVNCVGSSPGPNNGGGNGGPGVTPGTPTTKLQKEALLGLPPAAGARMLAGLRAFRGAVIVPIYSPAGRAIAPPGGGTGVVNCAAIARLGALGRCAPGINAAQATSWTLYGDDPIFTSKAIVGAASPAVRDDFAGQYLQAVLVKVSSPAMLERVRTYLITHDLGSLSGSAPRTFGEQVQARLGLAGTVQRLVDIAVALTLIVAGCSLAVAAGGGLVERKRPFTMLRLSGTPAGTLYRVVLLETVLPLAAATLVAAGTAYGISVLTVRQLGQPGSPLPAPGHVYYLTMGAGLVASLLVILATLPLLGRITGTENVRFE